LLPAILDHSGKIPKTKAEINDHCIFLGIFLSGDPPLAGLAGNEDRALRLFVKPELSVFYL